jgi:hypothetical protein
VPAIPPKPGKPGSQPVESEVDALIRAKREKEQLGLELKDAEEELERVKARYDQFFIGIERREPRRERDEIRKRVMLLKEAFTRNAALRFRIQTLHARYLSYERLWVRSAREKEEGTYRRDIFKARIRAQGGPGKKVEATPSAVPQPGAAAGRTASPAANAAPSAQASAAPAWAAPADDPKMRALYDAYVAAKKQCGEDVSRLSYDTVARSVSKQVPELMAKFKAKTVDFRVEVRDGRAVLKAIPKV